MTLRSFGPGDKVPNPGIYAVLHGHPHPQYLSAFIDTGTFPNCKICGAAVTFRLIQQIGNIRDEADFHPDEADIRKTA
jgi:hypothetical protein